MLEIQLMMLFIISLAVIIINGIVIIRNYHTPKKNYILIVPLSKDSEDIELIVRKVIYKLANEYPEAIVVLVNFNADEEKIQIFKKLMKHSCKYIIVNCEKSSENVCNIIESVIY